MAQVLYHLGHSLFSSPYFLTFFKAELLFYATDTMEMDSSGGCSIMLRYMLKMPLNSKRLKW
jgi:hypothetical protein